MGAARGVDPQRDKITLYTSQTDQVVDRLLKDGVHYVKMEYVAEKYAEAASVFLHAYSWYAENAGRILPRPPQAQSAVWAFCGAQYLDRSPCSQILKLSVPVESAVFFRMSDWNRILNLQYLGEGPQEQQKFSQKLTRCGAHDELDAYLTPFYPHLKKEIQKSWKALFRYDRMVKETGAYTFPDMQAGLWCLKQDWVEQIGL